MGGAVRFRNGTYAATAAEVSVLMNHLIVTVGLPRSGKTTWARSTGYPIVNPDSIRLALHGQRFYAHAEPMVWAIAYIMVDALFRAGNETVVADATNVTVKRRMQWLDRFDDDSCAVEFRVFSVSPEECKRRAIAANDTEIILVIDRMAAEWDLPALWDVQSEGADVRFERVEEQRDEGIADDAGAGDR